MSSAKRALPNPLESFVKSGQIGSYQAIQDSLYTVREVHIEAILDSPYQTRETMSPEKWRRLVKSMKEVGPQGFSDAIAVRRHPEQEGKWQIVRGGHSRRDAAREAGLTMYPIIEVEWDNKKTGLATARENLAREDLTPVEEGKLYLLLRRDFGYTQETLAEEIGVSRDRIKECEALAKSAPDILDMIQRARQLDDQGEGDRGLRAAKCLRRLDDLDAREQGLAARVRAPLIEAFLKKLITTDWIDIATKRLLNDETPDQLVVSFLASIEQSEEEAQSTAPAAGAPDQLKPEKPTEIVRQEKLTLATRRFRQFTTLIGERPPTAGERATLQQVRSDIDQILNRK